MTHKRTLRSIPRLAGLALAALSLLAAGCATTVRVTSDPPGAEVFARGKGRAAYKWDYKGVTPATYRSYYNKDLIRVRWSDRQFSPPQEASLIMEKDASVHFTR